MLKKFFSRPVLIAYGIAGSLAVKNLSKYITDRVISKKIEDALTKTRCKIQEWYDDYRKNVIISFSLNTVIILLTIIPYYFFSINNTIIIIISSISLFMMARFIYRAIRDIRKIIPYLYHIKEFINDLMLYKSISIPIKGRIIEIFNEIYESNTNKVSRIAHSTIAMLGFVKSYDDIEGEVVNEFYKVIKTYLINNIIYKIMAFSVFYFIFIFFLKPFVFTNVMKMNIIEAVLYPFTVALPNMINIIIEFFK